MEAFGRQEKYGTFGFGFRYSSGAVIRGKPLLLQHLRRCPSKPVSGSCHFLSILRGATLINDGVTFETLPLVLLISAPVGIVEGYGIYLTIKKSLSRTMSMRRLGYIYGVFFGASVMEVGFINLLALFAV
jgi:hypothetical protein